MFVACYRLGRLWFQLLKGVLVVVLFLGWGLSEKFRNPFYISFVCGVMVFFLHRFVTTIILRTRRSSDRHSIQGDIDSL